MPACVPALHPRAHVDSWLRVSTADTIFPIPTRLGFGVFQALCGEIRLYTRIEHTYTWSVTRNNTYI